MKIASWFLFAWVIWKLTVLNSGASAWEFIGAYTVEKDCQAQLKSFKREKDTFLESNHLLYFRTDGAAHFYCVPDTVDPRPRS